MAGELAASIFDNDTAGFGFADVRLNDVRRSELAMNSGIETSRHPTVEMRGGAMETKPTGIPLRQVRPFFQVVVFVDPELREFDLRAEMKRAAGARRRKDSTFRVVSSERHKDLQYLHVEHTMDPSWLRGPSRFKDTENDEVVLYRKRNLVFIHSNCRALLDLLTSGFSEQLDRVRAGEVEKVLALRRPEIRSLGMQNLTAPGRSAPESKVYFARDAAYTLSPVRDGMFGFRHAFAVEPATGGKKSKPFGCSTRKRKIWGTWVQDTDAFMAECDRLAADLTARAPGKPWSVLAAPLANPPAGVVPIAFYADYSIDRKGMVWLEGDDGEFSANWTCYFSKAGTVRFEVTKDARTVSSFELRIDRDGAKVSLAYLEGASQRRVKLCDEAGELEHRRVRDLVEMLNHEEAFTLVFTKGVSYRVGEFWRNTGLDEVFGRVRTDMNWADIDITKESLVAGRRDTIGDAILRYLRAEGWPEVVICDDGSNEIADYIALGKSRVALIHAKFSCKRAVGLRVDDVQVILAQCLKNLQFFQWTALEPHVGRLLGKVRPEFQPSARVEDLLAEVYENQRTRRECWIVQPGISAARLAADRRNKIHSLLNHAESACLTGNVEFHFFCSA
jgi:hypothetical protein